MNLCTSVSTMFYFNTDPRRDEIRITVNLSKINLKNTFLCLYNSYFNVTYFNGNSVTMRLSIPL